MHHATRTPNLKWNEQGLLPAIIQDSNDGTVLMLGWMNADSLQLTQERGEVVFWSRSRQTLWHKGETSGNVLEVVSIRTDCDQDALLIRATPAGPTCHTGERSCFFQVISEE
jgi:phosphoribosyl-AMP cyclohydrolase